MKKILLSIALAAVCAFAVSAPLKFVKHTLASLANTKPMWEYTFKNDFSQMIFFKKRHFSCKKKHRYSLPWKIYLSILARKIVLFLLLLCTLN